MKKTTQQLARLTALELITRKRSGKRISIALIVSVFLISSLAGSLTVSCNGSPNSGEDDTLAYFLQAYLLRNMDRNTAAARVFFRKNDTETPSGPVNIDTTRLDFTQSTGIFELSYTSVNDIDTGIHILAASDAGTEIVNRQIIMTDTFAIRVTTPANRIYTGSGSVVVDPSSLSLNAQGYIVATVKAGMEYTGVGRAVWVNAVTSSGVLSPDFFRDPSDSTGATLDTGKYYIYMYSYRGAPQVDAINSDFPTVLPDGGFAENLVATTSHGHFGAILISRRDSIFVQQL